MMEICLIKTKRQCWLLQKAFMQFLLFLVNFGFSVVTLTNFFNPKKNTKKSKNIHEISKQNNIFVKFNLLK